MNPFTKNTKQTSIFVTAGYPEFDSLPAQLQFLKNQGIDFIEIGIPFSDPMADGPTIQATSSVALKNGMTIEHLFAQLKSCSNELTIPLVLMGYLNPVMQYGIDRFLENCKELNIRSLILPDLSLELYEAKYKTHFEQAGIPLSFLITPQTPDSRIERVAQTCKNSFVYLVSQNSITGGQAEMSEALLQRYQSIRDLCGETPLFLGFGIDSAEKRQQGFENCDGVIVGSAYLKALASGKQGQFLNELLAIPVS